jgi:hypothetical protein
MNHRSTEQDSANLLNPDADVIMVRVKPDRRKQPRDVASEQSLPRSEIILPASSTPPHLLTRI